MATEVPTLYYAYSQKTVVHCELGSAMPVGM